MITTTLTSNVANLVQFRDIMRQGFAGPISNPLAAALEQNAYSYLQYIYERFMSSGGDRPWKPLSRDRIVAKGHSFVLLDTGELREAFNPIGHAAQRRERSERGMTITISGGDHSGTNLSLGALAQVHHEGTRKTPRRPIFVPAPEALRSQMENRLRRGFDQAKRQAKLDKGPLRKL